MMQRSGMFLARASAFLLALGLVGNAAAQATDYPSRAIKMIAPAPPGGPIDLFSRMVGKKLSDAWGQPILVENYAGAGGTMGIDMVAKAPPNGYTIAMGNAATLAVAPGLYAKLPYDPLRDLAPVVNIAFTPFVLVVNANVPAKSVRELIELAKSKKGSLTYGSGGIGSMSNLAMELLKAMTRVEILHVPYKGIAPAMVSVISGEMDMGITDLAMAGPHVKAGKLRVLAITSSRRSAAAPQLPTMDEAGIKGYAADIWYGVVAPARTPENIVAKLNSAILTALKAPDVQQRFDELGYTAIGDTPEQFGATIRADIEKFGRIIKDANIKQQ